jgi:hypothetical protein
MSTLSRAHQAFAPPERPDEAALAVPSSPGRVVFIRNNRAGPEITWIVVRNAGTCRARTFGRTSQSRSRCAALFRGTKAVKLVRNSRSGLPRIVTFAEHAGRFGIVGQSDAVADLIRRIELVSATRSTVLITGASGPQPHAGFIEVFDRAPLRDRHGKVAGAREDGAEVRRFKARVFKNV